MTDIWVCSTCHSINRQRNTSCYKCGASQDLATGEGATLRVEQALQTRAYVRYRSASVRALIAGVLILAVAGLGVAIMIASIDDAYWLRGQIANIINGIGLDRAELVRRTQDLVVPGLIRLGLAILALLSFGAWLSRVVMNIPALGGGVPRTSPTRAFIYPLIPIVNLFKVPGIIQDALYRLDPKAGGFFMVAIAWFGLVGSWIISFFAGWYVNFRLVSAVANAETPAELTAMIQSAFDIQLVVDIATTLLVAGGAVVLVIVMARIERRSEARDREIRAAGSAGLVGSDMGPPGADPAVAGPIEPAIQATVEPVVEPVTAAAPVLGVPMMEAMRPAELTDERPAGSRLEITVHRLGRIVATLDGDDAEDVTIDDIRQAAGALARSGGSARVSRADADDSTMALAEQVVAALRAGGVPMESGQP